MRLSSEASASKRVSIARRVAATGLLRSQKIPRAMASRSRMSSSLAYAGPGRWIQAFPSTPNGLDGQSPCCPEIFPPEASTQTLLPSMA
ncbi:hypothetical protein [Arthrobacter sp. 31Cvi3.1E]|uniref:hypothetical protein n=1 Tax=Paenarthrobacter nicotinovorans TaxID=29320 RepID=UPI0015C41089